MNYIKAEGISKRYGVKLLFENIDISINKGQKVALVARNGTGKSSLLKILVDLDSPDSGTTYLRKDIKVGYLAQNPEFNDSDSVLEAIFYSDNPTLNLIRNYEAALEQQELYPSERNRQNLAKIMEEMSARNAWDYEAKVKQILSQFNIHRFDQKVGLMSGGEQKRVALASVLVQEPDLLVMDEPTNHLDLEMVEWLENYLNRQNFTLLLVTHDRYFLNRVTTEIIELEKGHTHIYRGYYEYFLEKKVERELVFKQEVTKARKLMQKELVWIRAQPKARTTKAKSRVDAFEGIKSKANQKIKIDEVSFDDIQMARVGKKTIDVKDIDKAYGGLQILKNFSYTFNRRDRAGIVGKNGVGKSTLLNLLVGTEKPDAGKITVGKTVVFGYYHQEGIQLKDDKKVIDVIRDVAEVLPLAKGKSISAAQLLDHFQFPYHMHHNYVSTLSGGEKRRLYLLTVLMENPNFLILDEPTNDLDLLTLNVLEDFLLKFEGCLLIVSHDRYFMDKLVDHVFVFEGNGKVRDFPGNYSRYREAKNKEIAQEREEKKVVKSQQDPTPVTSYKTKDKAKTKLSYKEKLEFEQLETDIEKLEDEKADLNDKLNSGAGDHEELRQWAERLGTIMQELDTKSDRWLELSEFA